MKIRSNSEQIFKIVYRIWNSWNKVFSFDSKFFNDLLIYSHFIHTILLSPPLPLKQTVKLQIDEGKVVYTVL